VLVEGWLAGLGEDFAGVFGERRAVRAGAAAAFRPSELEPPPGGEAAAAADVDAFCRCRLRSASARVAASSWPLRLVTSSSARAMAFARRAGSGASRGEERFGALACFFGMSSSLLPDAERQLQYGPRPRGCDGRAALPSWADGQGAFPGLPPASRRCGRSRGLVGFRREAAPVSEGRAAGGPSREVPRGHAFPSRRHRQLPKASGAADR